MAGPEERFTLPGTKLPPQQGLPPTLLFHRWQRYDCFWPDSFIDERNKVQKLTPFKRDFTGFSFLDRVAKEVQQQAQDRYKVWYENFSRAFEDLQVEAVIKATTLWRLVVGWGTNPAFETGLTLDHLLGFPYIPGSAVKGLLHRVAEQELLESPGGIPKSPCVLPDEPPPELVEALARALRVRALFGSLHLRRGQKVGPKAPPDERESDRGDGGSSRRQVVGPEAPFDRLAAWGTLLPKPGQEPECWTKILRQLVCLCSDAPAGGMVTCFDAVPDRDAFSETREVLIPDVLTPHKDNKPNPIPLLAVRDGVTFELRYRLAAWPSSPPRDREEEERVSDLGGIDRKTVAEELRRWLIRGLEELGLGGKTSAGYGYFYESQAPAIPEVLPQPPIPKSEKFARERLAEGLDRSEAANALERALRDPDPANRAAAAARFKSLYFELLDDWRGSLKNSKRERAELIDRLAEEHEK